MTNSAEIIGNDFDVFHPFGQKMIVLFDEDVSYFFSMQLTNHVSACFPNINTII